jgi:hypothetical protein
MQHQRDFKKGALKRVNVPSELIKRSSSTRSLQPSREVDRYMVAACGLMLIILLAAGAAGYASVRGAFGLAAETASRPRTIDPDSEADLATPVALALSLIGALMLAVAMAPGRIRPSDGMRTDDLSPEESNLTSGEFAGASAHAAPPSPDLPSLQRGRSFIESN